MNYSYRHPKGKSASRMGGPVALVLLIIAGGYGVWWSIQWFRAHAEERQAEVQEEDAGDLLEMAALALPFEASTTLRSGIGDAVGVVQRKGTVELPTYSGVFNLIGLDGATQAYELWMLKDGLADVRSVGELTQRADGSWVHEWTVKDPLDYTHIVIMLEPRDGNAAPSGNKVAEGSF